MHMLKKGNSHGNKLPADGMHTHTFKRNLRKPLLKQFDTTTLEQTVEELTKCFLLEFGENKSLSFGRCKKMKSFTELYDGLNNIE